MRLLFIEDNPKLAQHTAKGLEKAGFAVDHVSLGEDAVAAAETTHYDIALLDLGLPDIDGMTVLERIRQSGNELPILILTARDDLQDRIDGLNRGADDYLLKPFAFDELTARIKALLRRPGHILGLKLETGNLSFDTLAREVTVDDQTVRLSRRELDILEQLMRRAGRIVPKDVLEDSIYGFDREVSSNSIEVALHRLRKRLQNAGASATIHTMRGIGYILEADGA